jgi:hypothetical protein
MVAAAVGAYEAWESIQRPIGRPRKYADTAARRRAWNEEGRKKPGPLADISAGATEEMVTAAPRADVAGLGVPHDSYPYPT